MIIDYHQVAGSPSTNPVPSLPLAVTYNMSHGRDLTPSDGMEKNPLREMERLAKPILAALPPLRMVISGGKDGSDFNAIEEGMQQAIHISEQVQTLLHPLQELESRIDSLKKEHARIDAEVRAEKTSYDTLKREAASMEKTLSVRTAERDGIQKDVEGAKMALHALHHEIGSKHRENEDMNNKLAEFGRKTIEMQAAERDLHDRQQAISDAEYRIAEMDADIDCRDAELQPKEQELIKRENEVLEQCRINDEVAEQLQRKEAILDHKKKAFDEARAALDEEKTVLKGDRDNLISNTMELSRQRAEVADEKYRNRTDRAHLSQAIACLRASLGIVGISAVPDDYEGVAEHAVTLTETLVAEINNQKGELRSLYVQIENARKEALRTLQSGNVERSRLEKEIEDLKQQISNGFEALESMSSSNNELKLSLESRSKEKESLVSRCSQLQTDLSHEKQELCAKTAKVTECERVNEDLKTSASNLEETIANLQRRIVLQEGELRVAKELDEKLHTCREDLKSEKTAKLRLQSEMENLRNEVSQIRHAQLDSDSSTMSEAQRILQGQIEARKRLDDMIQQQASVNLQYSEKLRQVTKKEADLEAHWRANKASVEKAEEILDAAAVGCWCGRVLKEG